MKPYKTLAQLLKNQTVFGRLTVLCDAPPKISKSGFSARTAYVECTCGTVKIVRVGELRTGQAKSCGCLQRELVAERSRVDNRKHGMAGAGRSTEYVIWTTMKARCHNPDDAGFKNYGARGIYVCEQWRESFETFLADVGLRPSKDYSLDRIKNDGPYAPGNVRWATSEEQHNNTRQNVVLEIDGRQQTVAQWAREVKTDPMRIYVRLRDGWSDYDAVMRPKRWRRPV